MSVRKPVGRITAYAAAVKGGYTGTYEEFCAEQANFAKNAQKVAEDRAAVETLKTDTQGIKDAAVKEVGDAKNDALTSIGDTASEKLTDIQTAGSAQVKAVQDAGAAERAALAEAAEEKTAEVEERIEAKGAAVRDSIPEDYTDTVKRVGELSEEIDNITMKQNLFDASTLKNGGYYNSDGSIRQEPDSCYSEQYIEVEPNVEYMFDSSWVRYLCSCYYDSNKHFISRNNNHSEDGTVTFQEGVKYVRFSFYQKNGTGFKFAKTVDFNNVTDEYGALIDGTKIVNAPFEKVITKDIFTETVNSGSLFVTYGGNYYPDGNGIKTELSDYNWFEFVAPCDFEIWADDNVTDSDDLILAIYRNGEATSSNFVRRLRKDNTIPTNTLPTSEAKLSITKGQLVVISLWKTNVFNFYAKELTFGEKKFNDNILLNDEQIEQVKGNNTSVVVSASEYLINLNGYTVHLLRDDNDSTRAHLWNVRGIEKDGVVIVPKGTDIVGVLKEMGETDFMGGVHGDETNVEFHILADGKPITENCSCKQLDILMYSHLTRVSTGENIIDRYVHIVMRDNYIEVDTTFKCLVDDFNLAYAYNGGMFAWYDSMTDFAMYNAGIINSGGGTSAMTLAEGSEIYQATTVIGDNVVACENVIGHEMETYLGEVFYYGNETLPRVKIYFGTDNNSVWQSGHICKGKARYTFN